MSKNLIEIENRHVSSSGKPPILNDDNALFTAYFENRFGEQNVMQYDPQDDVCRLWMGDVGWQELRVEQFGKFIIIVFAKSRKERQTEKQVENQQEIEAVLRCAIRKNYGKKLTDEQCDYILNRPIMNQGEIDVIFALYRIWKRLKA